MKHKLILFYGSSSGAGKSTLSSRLQQVLTVHNLPVCWLYEDDVLHLDFFTPVMQHMRGEGDLDMPDACLAATAKLVEAYADSDTVIVADSILPYYDWLFAADYDAARIEAFSRKLQEQVRLLRPLIVYLKADVATVLQRAVDQRGEKWLYDLIAFMNSWNANKAQPISDLAGVIAYLQRTDQQKIQLLSEWTGDVLSLDSAQNSIDACATTLLNYLELAPLSDQQRQLPKSIRKRYVGHYTTADADPPDGQQRLVITLRHNELWTNLYWPNGCRLMAENEQTFQLEGTNHRLVFDEPTTAHERRLQYHYCGKIYTYREVEALVR